MYYRLMAFLCAGAGIVASVAEADVVVIANRSRQRVRFDLVQSEAAARPFAVEPGGTVAFDVERPARLRLDETTEQREFSLDVDSAYFFRQGPAADRIELEKIGLSEAEASGRDNPGPAPAASDRPARKPPEIGRGPGAAMAFFTIPVKILVDEDDRAARRVWEGRLRKRVAAASEIFERQFHVRFEVVAVDTWISANDASDFESSLQEFQRVVEPSPAKLALGFTSQYETPDDGSHLGALAPPLSSHVLIPEFSPRFLETDRCELLVHALGHYLGAVHSPEPDSAMRAVLGDHKSAARNFSIGIDPLNSLAIALVVEQVRQRGATSLAELTPHKRRRLTDIYATLGRVMPDDPVCATFSSLAGARTQPSADLPRSPDAAQGDAPASEPPPAAVEVEVDAFIKSMQRVMEGVMVVARDNARSTSSSAVNREAGPLSGDDLTGRYMRSAAAAALTLPPEQRGPAFLLGAALAIDRTEELRKFAVVRDFVQRIETDADRDRRLEVLGHPTWGGREDLAQHFTFSAAIAALAGSRAAETVGLAKELNDSAGPSGFSFVDWCAERAGIAFAKRLQSGEITLESLARRFRTADFLPGIDGLEEGLSRKQFDGRYGSTSDKRFRAIDDDIRRRIELLYEPRD